MGRLLRRTTVHCTGSPHFTTPASDNTNAMADDGRRLGDERCALSRSSAASELDRLSGGLVLGEEFVEDEGGGDGEVEGVGGAAHGDGDGLVAEGLLVGGEALAFAAHEDD